MVVIDCNERDAAINAIVSNEALQEINSNHKTDSEKEKSILLAECCFYI